MPRPPTTDGFQVSYTARDAILYALSIGFGSSESDYQNDLRYLYESHPEFQVIPMWGLTLLFWANNEGNNGVVSLPSFPPPMMKAMKVIPREFLTTVDVALEDYPVLTHLSVDCMAPKIARSPPRPARGVAYSRTVLCHSTQIHWYHCHFRANRLVGSYCYYYSDGLHRAVDSSGTGPACRSGPGVLATYSNKNGSSAER